ncbi:MAG: UvrB/UvrC motif-containing protein [Bacteroidia bacterium]|nr:UvrB/UvrC motif-containing protein [Bacteroidia bacterium]
MEKARKNMEKAASELDFIQAARFRDEISDLQVLLRNKSQ